MAQTRQVAWGIRGMVQALATIPDSLSIAGPTSTRTLLQGQWKNGGTYILGQWVNGTGWQPNGPRYLNDSWQTPTGAYQEVAQWQEGYLDHVLLHMTETGVTTGNGTNDNWEQFATWHLTNYSYMDNQNTSGGIFPLVWEQAYFDSAQAADTGAGIAQTFTALAKTILSFGGNYPFAGLTATISSTANQAAVSVSLSGNLFNPVAAGSTAYGAYIGAAIGIGGSFGKIVSISSPAAFVANFAAPTDNWAAYSNASTGSGLAVVGHGIDPLYAVSAYGNSDFFWNRGNNNGHEYGFIGRSRHEIAKQRGLSSVSDYSAAVTAYSNYNWPPLPYNVPYTGTGNLNSVWDQDGGVYALKWGIQVRSGAITQIGGSLAGSGTLSGANATLNEVAGASLAGAGGLAASALNSFRISATLAGTGALTVAPAALAEVAKAALAGTGTMAGQAPAQGTATLAGTGAEASAASQGMVSPASLAGAGSLTINITIAGVAFASFTGTGTGTLSIASLIAKFTAGSVAGAGTMVANQPSVRMAAGASLGGAGHFQGGFPSATTYWKHLYVGHRLGL